MNHHQDHPITAIVNTPGNNKQRPQTCLSIQLMQRCTNNNPDNDKATKTKKPGIYATASLETVDLDQNKVDEFTITLDTDIFGRVDTVFDSGHPYAVSIKLSLLNTTEDIYEKKEAHSMYEPPMEIFNYDIILWQQLPRMEKHI